MIGELTPKELANFDKYKHSAGKTTFEKFCIDRVFNHIEPLYPPVNLCFAYLCRHGRPI